MPLGVSTAPPISVGSPAAGRILEDRGDRDPSPAFATLTASSSPYSNAWIGGTSASSEGVRSSTRWCASGTRPSAGTPRRGDGATMALRGSWSAIGNRRGLAEPARARSRSSACSVLRRSRRGGWRRRGRRLRRRATRPGRRRERRAPSPGRTQRALSAAGIIRGLHVGAAGLSVAWAIPDGQSPLRGRRACNDHRNLDRRNGGARHPRAT